MSPEVTSNQARLGWRTKFAYGIGQVGEQVKTRGMDLFVFFYFQQVLGLSGTLAGAAVAIALVFDAITDPIAGSLSDNWKSPRGRRHPFMYAAAIPLGIFWFMLFFPPAGLGQTGLFVWLTVFAILVRGAMTLYHVPHLALGAELSTDYEERTSVVAYRIMFGMVGGVATSAIGVAVFFPRTAEFENGLLNPAGYPNVATFGAIVMVVTIWYSAWGTRDQIPHLPPAPEQPESFSARRVVREYAEAWSIRSFRALFLGFSIFAIGFGVTQTLATHIYVFFWEFSSEQIAMLTLPLGLGFAVGVTVVRGLHSRFDKKPIMIASSFTATLSANLMVILRLLDVLPANGGAILLPLVAITATITGVLAAIAFVSASSMMADVAVEYELLAGESKTGVVLAAASFSGKLASGAGHVIAGIGIDLIAFPTQAKDPALVAPELIARLGLLNLTAAVVGAASIYMYTFYRITRESNLRTLQELGTRAP